MLPSMDDESGNAPAAGLSGGGPTLRGGVLFNREAIALIELPFEHELAEMQGGWRLGATKAGRLTVQLTNGHRQSFDLAAGDWLAASGQELYLSLASGRPAGPTAPEPTA